ncbi:hypothetical protein F5887DRAFT_918772 [Amanita rubescens]|nr:hypothetical protein F5887DRAFT_918772 [Amanita rubescens]
MKPHCSQEESTICPVTNLSVTKSLPTKKEKNPSAHPPPLLLAQNDHIRLDICLVVSNPTFCCTTTSSIPAPIYFGAIHSTKASDLLLTATLDYPFLAAARCFKIEANTMKRVWGNLININIGGVVDEDADTDTDHGDEAEADDDIGTTTFYPKMSPPTSPLAHSGPSSVQPTEERRRRLRPHEP